MATFQGLRYVTPLTINSRERFFRSETLSLKTQTVGNGAQRWDLVVTLETSNNQGNADGAALAIHRAVTGFTGRFDMEMPQHLGTDVDPGTTEVRTTVAHAVGASALSVGVQAGRTLDIPAGRYISVGAQRKIYLVTDAVTVTDSGQTLNVFPPLVDAASDDTIVNLSPDILVYYAEDGVEGVTYTDGILTQATINVIEALT